MFKEY